jgi:succinate-semialdehyde dehydrogenase/glutarate-semialdehyde dehydrogenase
VHASIVDVFTVAARDAMATEVLGHALEPTTTVGPLINEAQRARVARIVEASVDAGARIVCGGVARSGPGFFYAPTILSDVPADAPILREEIFGPVLPIVPFHDVDDVTSLANDSEYGLAGYVWTRDLKWATQLADALECGLVGINDWYPVTSEAPFGGVKQSGMGRESGLEGVLEYVDVKARFFGLG